MFSDSKHLINGSLIYRSLVQHRSGSALKCDWMTVPVVQLVSIDRCNGILLSYINTTDLSKALEYGRNFLNEQSTCLSSSLVRYQQILSVRVEP